MRDGGFLSLPGQDAVVRDRSFVASATLRKPEMLPPAEVRAAVLSVVRRNLGATRDEIVVAVARALGFKSTSAQLRDIITGQVDGLPASGDLVAKGGVLVQPKPEMELTHAV